MNVVQVQGCEELELTGKLNTENNSKDNVIRTEICNG